MSVFSGSFKRNFKKAAAWSMAALTAMTCAASLPSALPSASAVGDILSNEERGVIYANSRSDFRDETIYFLITTRFYDGDPSNNEHCVDDTKAQNPDSDPAWRGDFKGLIDKLDYIKALGFTAIWITPVVQNRSSYDYHGYHAYDFTAVDNRYESNGITYQDLIDACHSKGMKVIQDVVFNHSCNWGEKNLCPIEIDVWSPNGRSDLVMGNERGLSMDPNKIYHHFGYAGSGDYDNYNVQITTLHSDCFDLNTENPTVYNYLIDCYKRFVDMGVDAFRVDTVKHISRLTLNKTFVPAMQDEYKKVHSGSGYDDFYMFGEVCTKGESTWYRDNPPISTCFYTWADDDSWLSKWTTDPDANIALTEEHYNAHLDKSKQPTSDNAFLNGNDYHTPDYSKRSGLDSIDFQMHWQFDNAGQAFGMALDEDPYFNDSTWSVTYVNSHDYSPNTLQNIIPNFTEETWAEDLNLIFTFRGIPCIYYGTEIRFQHGKQIDPGPNAPLSETGRAYFGDNIEGTLSTTAHGVFDASDGTVKSTLESPLAQHLIRLNRLRQAIPALRKGQYSTKDISGGGMAFKRRYTDANVDSFCCVTVSGSATFSNIPNGTYVDAVTGDTQNVTGGTLTANCSGQGNLRVYVLSTSKTPAPGRVVPNGSFMGDGGSAVIINHESVNTVKPTGITLDKTSVTILEEETAAVKATITPSGASAAVSWSSSNPSVATVSGGIIKGISPGTATVTAKVTDTIKATVSVTVKTNTNIVRPTGITVTPSSLTMTKGGSETLTATVTPSNATDKSVTWASSNTSVATVSNGTVTAVGTGTTTITATTSNGLSASATVTVEGKSLTYIENGVYFEKPSTWGNSINAYIYDSATDSPVLGQWPGVAMTNDGDGVYYYKYETSSTTLKVIFNDGSNQVPGSQQPGFDYKNRGYYTEKGFDRIIEKVDNVDVTSVTVSPSSASVKVGATTTLNAAVAPSNATNKTITWTSSNPSVATVSGGVVTGVAKGTAVITASSVNGKTGTATITVTSNDVETLVNNSTISATRVAINDSVTVNFAASGGTKPYQFDLRYKKSTDDSYTTAQSYASGSSASITFKSTGTYTVVTRVKDSAATVASKSFTVTVITGDATLKNTSKISADSIYLGESVTVTCSASGGTSPYQYAVYYKKSTSSSYTTAQSFSTSKTVSIKPGSATDYNIVVKVKDSQSMIARKEFTLTVNPESTVLKNNSTLSATSVPAGTKVTIKGAASGGTKPYQFAYYYKKSSSSSYTTIKGYSTTTSVTFTPAVAGITYNVLVKVKDAEGTYVSKTFKVSTITTPLSFSVSAASIPLGKTVTAKVTGGTSSYQFAYFYKKVSSDSWTTGKSYSTATSYTFKPAAAVKYNLMIKAKDSSGSVQKKTFTITVTPAELANVSTVSATSVTIGNSVKVTGKATGGTSPYTYGFYYKKSTASSWSTGRNPSSTATYTFKPASAGTYELRVVIRDSKDAAARKTFTITASKSTELANTSTVSKTSITLGSKIIVYCSASGGSEPYKYSVSYKKSTSSDYTSVQTYSTNAKVSITPASATKYSVLVKVKDSAGTVKSKVFTLNVT